MRPVRATDYIGIDLTLDIVLWGITIVGIFSFGILIYGVWKYYYKRHPEADQSIPPAFKRLVFLDVLIIIFDLVLLAISIYFWADLLIRNEDERIAQLAQEDNAEVVHVKVIGRQFFWTFLYPGPDGQWNTNDDFLTANELVLPLNAYVLVDITANDVLHSFFLPNFRLKYDAIPGLNTRLWFKTTEAGTFEIACAELCGAGHYRMAARLRVLPENKYRNWLVQTAGQFPDHLASVSTQKPSTLKYVAVK